MNGVRKISTHWLSSQISMLYCCFMVESVAESRRVSRLKKPNRIRRRVTLACLGLHDSIDGSIRASDALHDNLLTPTRASVELHHHRHRCCVIFHVSSVTELPGESRFFFSFFQLGQRRPEKFRVAKHEEDFFDCENLRVRLFV